MFPSKKGKIGVKQQKKSKKFGYLVKGTYLCSALDDMHRLGNRIVLWCNGSTAVFGSACLGSNPGKTTLKSARDENSSIADFCIYNKINY